MYVVKLRSVPACANARRASRRRQNHAVARVLPQAEKRGKGLPVFERARRVPGADLGRVAAGGNRQVGHPQRARQPLAAEHSRSDRGVDRRLGRQPRRETEDALPPGDGGDALRVLGTGKHARAARAGKRQGREGFPAAWTDNAQLGPHGQRRKRHRSKDRRTQCATQHHGRPEQRRSGRGVRERTTSGARCRRDAQAKPRSYMVPKRDNGQTRRYGTPMMSLSSTKPQYLESNESRELSPRTK